MGVLNKGTDFSNGDQVTDSNLDNLVDNATFTSSAVDEVSTSVGGTGAIIVKDGGITTGKLADSTGAADGVTTAKIATGAVTKAKIENVADMKVLGNTSGSSAAPQEVSILDEDDMSSDSSTALATQQSIKAYVDAHGIVQRTRVASGTAITVPNSSIIPFDDTVPQSGEGTEILTTSFTPKSTSNRIEVSFNGLIAQFDPGVGMVLALFEDTTCKGAKWFAQPSFGSLMSHITFEFTPSSTNTATYSLRIGNGGTTSNPLYVNRQSNFAGTLGGLMEYSMTVLELKA